MLAPEKDIYAKHSTESSSVVTIKSAIESNHGETVFVFAWPALVGSSRLLDRRLQNQG